MTTTKSLSHPRIRARKRAKPVRIQVSDLASKVNVQHEMWIAIHLLTRRISLIEDALTPVRTPQPPSIVEGQATEGHVGFYI